MESYRPRLLDEELAEVLTSHPAVLVVGPGACGKTTTTRRQCRSILRLDVPASPSSSGRTSPYCSSPSVMVVRHAHVPCVA